MALERKILSGLERLSETLKSLLWEKAKTYGISPIQIQILLFVSTHKTKICNVSYLAREFNVTKATISDAVKVLLKKEYLEKDFSPTDNRRYNLLTTSKGRELVTYIEEYSLPIEKELTTFSEKELLGMFDTLTKLIFQLNRQGIIQVQRTCFNCTFYKGDKKNTHYCQFIESPLENRDIRIDCGDFQEKVRG